MISESASERGRGRMDARGEGELISELENKTMELVEGGWMRVRG